MSFDEVTEVLAEARASGFLGPGAIEDHIGHARGFASAAGPAPDRALDLGSGGGLPGLVLALEWPESELVLLDGSARRTAFLEGAVRRLGLQERVRVVRAVAESAGRQPELRGSQDVVVARSFAAPAVTAECGAALLRIGGMLVVSEPPELPAARWPRDGLAELGLGAPDVHRTAVGSYVRIPLVAPVPDRYPRRVGVPAKRPVF